MGEVTVTLNGRTYRLECDDGEQQYLLSLSEMMSERIDTMKKQFGQVGDDRLLLMAGLMVADELSEAQRKLREAEAKLERIEAERASASEQIESEHAQVADKISAAADRIEVLSASLDDGSETGDTAKSG